MICEIICAAGFLCMSNLDIVINENRTLNGPITQTCYQTILFLFFIQYQFHFLALRLIEFLALFLFCSLPQGTNDFFVHLQLVFHGRL